MFASAVLRIIKQFKGSITKQIGFSIWKNPFMAALYEMKRSIRKSGIISIITH